MPFIPTRNITPVHPEKVVPVHESTGQYREQKSGTASIRASPTYRATTSSSAAQRRQAAGATPATGVVIDPAATARSPSIRRTDARRGVHAHARAAIRTVRTRAHRVVASAAAAAPRTTAGPAAAAFPANTIVPTAAADTAGAAAPSRRRVGCRVRCNGCDSDTGSRSYRACRRTPRGDAVAACAGRRRYARCNRHDG